MLHICFFNVRICKNGLASYQWLCWVVEVVGTRPWQDCWGSQPPILIGSHFKSFIHVHWAASPDSTIEVWRHFKLRQYNVNTYLPAVVSDFSSLTFLYKKTWIGAVLVKVMSTTKCVMSPSLLLGHPCIYHTKHGQQGMKLYNFKIYNFYLFKTNIHLVMITIVNIRGLNVLRC